MKNARFWVYVNDGPVKLTLRPGQSLEHSEGGPCEEGYSYEYTKWEYADDEPVVYREWATDSRDCDGRHGNGGEQVCHVDRLLEGGTPGMMEGDDEETWAGVVWPDWQKHRDHSVYDQYAQMAGY